MSIKDRLLRVAGRPMTVINPILLPNSLDGWKDRPMRDLAVAILRLERNKGNDENLKTLIHFNQQVISACQNGCYDEVNTKLGLLEDHMRSVVKIGSGKRFHIFHRKGINRSSAKEFEEQLNFLKDHKDRLQSKTIINKYNKIWQGIS